MNELSRPRSSPPPAHVGFPGVSRLRAELAPLRRGLGSSTGRGIAFWIWTVLLGLLLPAPVALVVVAARLRKRGAPPPAPWRPPGRAQLVPPPPKSAAIP